MTDVRMDRLIDDVAALDRELVFAQTHGSSIDWNRGVDETLRTWSILSDDQPSIPWTVWRESSWFGPVHPWVVPPVRVNDLGIDPNGAVLVREGGSRVFIDTGVRVGRFWMEWLLGVIAVRAGFASPDAPWTWRLHDGRPTFAIHGSYARRFRFAMTMPPYTPDGPTLSLRMLASTWRTLDDLVHDGVVSRDAAQLLAYAVERNVTVIVSGVTGSGKTTLTAALLQFAGRDLNRRIIQIEDAVELPSPPQGASVEVLRSGWSFTECVRMALRQNPDMIVLGEVRGPEALAMLQAAATGHPGIATIHADDAAGALANLERLAASSADVASPTLARSLLVGGSTPLLVVHVGVFGGRRRVSEIVEVIPAGGTNVGEPIPMTTIFQYDPTRDQLIYRFPPTGKWFHGG